MSLSEQVLLELYDVATLAACQAGRLIANYGDEQVQIERKAGGDSLASQVVTEVDRLSQNLILEHLLPTCETYELGLLTEESEDDRSRLDKDYFWCIDPLDGTLPFVESTPGYSVSIALVSRQGVPVLGVVYDPVENTLYQGRRGKGARRNGEPWKLAPKASVVDRPLTFISDRSFEGDPRYEDTLKSLKEAAFELGCDGLTTILIGGAAMNACWTLEKAPACYFKFPKSKPGGGSLWDFAATACIVNEAGGVATDVSGKPLDLNRADSTFMNHRGVLFASDLRIARWLKESIGNESNDSR